MNNRKRIRATDRADGKRTTQAKRRSINRRQQRKLKHATR